MGLTTRSQSFITKTKVIKFKTYPSIFLTFLHLETLLLVPCRPLSFLQYVSSIRYIFVLFYPEFLYLKKLFSAFILMFIIINLNHGLRYGFRTCQRGSLAFPQLQTLLLVSCPFQSFLRYVSSIRCIHLLVCSKFQYMKKLFLAFMFDFVWLNDVTKYLEYILPIKL